MIDHHIFISYSRQQFYFAESVALHLQKKGLATWFDVQRLQAAADWAECIRQGLEASAAVLLVASRASLASEYVEKEWKAALAAGNPIFVAIFEAVKLPPDLEKAAVAIIDFRGNFKQALDMLLQCISSGAVHRDPIPVPRVFPFPRRMPRDVMLVALDLLFTSLYILGLLVTNTLNAFSSLPTISGIDLTNTLSLIIMFGMLFGALSCSFLYAWWTFVRRQFKYQTVMYLGGMQPFLALMVAWMSIKFSQAALARNPGQGGWGLPPPLWGISIGVAVALTLLGLYSVWAMVYSNDVLRWLPTGEAPQKSRQRQITALFGSAVFKSKSGTPMKRYQLHYCAADAAIAEKIRQRLPALPGPGDPSLIVKVWQSVRSLWSRSHAFSANSAQESAFIPSRLGLMKHPANEEIQVVILSNKTPKRLVESVLAKYGQIIAVVASGIQIPDDMSKFTQYQWVDYRNQSDEQLSVLATSLRDFDPDLISYSLSAVPESLQKAVVPLRVAVVTRLWQGITAQLIGTRLVELLISLPQGEVPWTLVALSPGLASGLMQFWVVGVTLNRRMTHASITAVLTASLAILAGPQTVVDCLTGSFTLEQLSELATYGILLFGFWRSCKYWLPLLLDYSSEALGPTLALPARKIWIRHSLFVAGMVLYFVSPFSLAMLVVPGK